MPSCCRPPRRQGQVLLKPPREVTLRYNEPVEASLGAVRLFDSQGRRIDTGATTKPSAQVVAVPIRTTLPDGAYVVTWRVISADSHPVQGSFTFQVGTERERDRTCGPSIGRQPVEQDRREQDRRSHLRRGALARLRCARVADRQCRLRGPDLARRSASTAGADARVDGLDHAGCGDGRVVPARGPVRRWASGSARHGNPA